MNNMDLANEVKAVAAASGQLDDIRILEENQRIETLDRKLQDIIALRKANPEASLMELCGIYERQTWRNCFKVRHETSLCKAFMN